MDKKSKILFLIVGLLIAASVAVTYWRIMVNKDYIIEGQTDCDPYADVCFIWECDPESTVEGEACTGDPEMDSWYFQVARRSAANIPLCDPDTDENCDPWTCAEGEKDCSVEFCTEENMEAQYAVSCNDPVAYAEENPYECDPEIDEDCEETACDPEADGECGEEETECEGEECEEADDECANMEEECEEEGEVEGASDCGENVICEDAEKIGGRIEAATSEVIEK